VNYPFNFSDLNSEVRVFAGGAAKGSNGALLSQRQNAPFSICMNWHFWLVFQNIWKSGRTLWEELKDVFAPVQ